jgi:hypothetical protein
MAQLIAPSLDFIPFVLGWVGTPPLRFFLLGGMGSFEKLGRNERCYAGPQYIAEARGLNGANPLSID